MPKLWGSRNGSARWSRAVTLTSLHWMRSATPAMKIRMETVTRLEEELFLLQTLGDDRSVTQVYIAGQSVQL
jgi:hypothetical protein